jgi:hypothetical protein
LLKQSRTNHQPAKKIAKNSRPPTQIMRWELVFGKCGWDRLCPIPHC